MDPGTLSLLTLGLTAAGAASSFMGGSKPKKPVAPTPASAPAPDSTQGAGTKTSFLSNAAAAATPQQSAGKTLLGQ